MDNQKISQIVHWLSHVKLTDGKADGRLPWSNPHSNLRPPEPTTRSAAAQSPLLQQATNQHHNTMAVPPKPEPIPGYEWQLAHVASVFGQGGSGGCVPTRYDWVCVRVPKPLPAKKTAQAAQKSSVSTALMKTTASSTAMVPDDSENLGYQGHGTLPTAPPDSKAVAPSEDDEEV